MPGRGVRIAEGRRDLHGGDDPQRAIEDPPVGHGIEVGSQRDGREGAEPSGDHAEQVAPRVHPGLGPRLAHPAGGEPDGRGVVRLVGQAGHASLGRAADPGELGETGLEPAGVDADGCHGLFLHGGIAQSSPSGMPW